jgi:flagellin-like hook-associated protein FlgL
MFAFGVGLETALLASHGRFANIVSVNSGIWEASTNDENLQASYTALQKAHANLQNIENDLSKCQSLRGDLHEYQNRVNGTGHARKPQMGCRGD